jgi:UDP-glucuronate decarboxylase
MHPNDGRVVSTFIMQALANEDITVFGDGQQTRSFCYVADLVEALLALMDTPESVTGPINLGNPTEFTMLELAKKVIDMTNSRSQIVHRPLPADDPRQRKPDISKAAEHLSWAPSTSLEVGLDRTIRYFEGLMREITRDAIEPT